MYKRVYILLATILLLLAVSACSKSEETLLSEDEQADYNIIFGEKTGDSEVKARNLFKIGETPYFVVTAKEANSLNDIKIQLSKSSGEDWETLTEAPYDISGEWKQFMNGIPAATFEQLGAGAYRLTILNGEEELVSGDFVFQEKESN